MTINAYLFLLLALAGRVHGVLFRHIGEATFPRIVAHLKSIKIAAHYSRADTTRVDLIFKNVRELLWKKKHKKHRVSDNKGMRIFIKTDTAFCTMPPMPLHV